MATIIRNMQIAETDHDAAATGDHAVFNAVTGLWEPGPGSPGGPDTNFAITDLTFTGDRTHSGAGFGMDLTGLDRLDIQGTLPDGSTSDLLIGQALLGFPADGVALVRQDPMTPQLQYVSHATTTVGPPTAITGLGIVDNIDLGASIQFSAQPGPSAPTGQINVMDGGVGSAINMDPSNITINLFGGPTDSIAISPGTIVVTAPTVATPLIPTLSTNQDVVTIDAMGNLARDPLVKVYQFNAISGTGIEPVAAQLGGNTATGDQSAALSGAGNTAASDASAVLGGISNTVASGISGSIVGGDGNTVSAPRAFIAGGTGSTLSGDSASSVGGGGNIILGDQAGAFASVNSNLGGVGSVAVGAQFAQVLGANSVAFGRGAIIALDNSTATGLGPLVGADVAQSFTLRQTTNAATFSAGGTASFIFPMPPTCEWGGDVRIMARDTLFPGGNHQSHHFFCHSLAGLVTIDGFSNNLEDGYGTLPVGAAYSVSLVATPGALQVDVTLIGGGGVELVCELQGIEIRQ